MPPEGNPSRRADPARVLAVDDDPGFEAILRASLAAGGSDIPFDITCGVSNAEAVEALARSSYDVITVDIRLPDANGLDLLDRTRSDENVPPVIISTAHGGERIAERSFEPGASGYVIKDQEMPAARFEFCVRDIEPSQDDARVGRARS